MASFAGWFEHMLLKRFPYHAVVHDADCRCQAEDGPDQSDADGRHDRKGVGECEQYGDNDDHLSEIHLSAARP